MASLLASVFFGRSTLCNFLIDLSSEVTGNLSPDLVKPIRLRLNFYFATLAIVLKPEISVEREHMGVNVLSLSVVERDGECSITLLRACA
jgi:hypothetical protein